MPAAGIYECYDNGKLIGTGKATYWSGQIGISHSQVCKLAITGLEYKRRYTFVKVEKPVENVWDRPSKEWCREWDETCAKLRALSG